MRYLIMLLLLCPAVLSAQDRLKAMGRTLAAEIRKSDSSSLVKIYGPDIPVGDILAPGYELLHIDTRGTSSPGNDGTFGSKSLNGDESCSATGEYGAWGERK